MGGPLHLVVIREDVHVHFDVPGIGAASWIESLKAARCWTGRSRGPSASSP